MSIMPSGRRPVEHEVVLDLRELTADALEHRRELGVDVDDRRVAVVGDVRSLLVAQPVVERHRGDADLAGRVHHLHEPDRVLPAPHDLRVAGPDTEVEQHVRQPVRCCLEFGERELPERAVGTVVDHRQLVPLCQCSTRSESPP